MRFYLFIEDDLGTEILEQLLGEFTRLWRAARQQGLCALDNRHFLTRMLRENFANCSIRTRLR